MSRLLAPGGEWVHGQGPSVEGPGPHAHLCGGVGGRGQADLSHLAVLVTDLDCGGIVQGQESEESQEPSPFTASMHSLVQQQSQMGQSAWECVYTDSVLPDPDYKPGSGVGGGGEEGGGATGQALQAALGGWDYNTSSPRASSRDSGGGGTGLGARLSVQVCDTVPGVM